MGWMDEIKDMRDNGEFGYGGKPKPSGVPTGWKPVQKRGITSALRAPLKDIYNSYNEAKTDLLAKSMTPGMDWVHSWDIVPTYPS